MYNCLIDSTKGVNEMDEINFELQEIAQQNQDEVVAAAWDDMMFETYQRDAILDATVV
jgi:hypothetical protein